MQGVCSAIICYTVFMSGLAQKRGLESEDKDKNMTISRKSDRQGLSIIPGYEDDIPLPEYRPPPPRDQGYQDPGINTINVDSLEPETAISNDQPAGLTDLVPDPSSFLGHTFDGLPLSQNSVTAMTGTYDFTSLPVLLTVFAATILGSMIAPLLTFPVTSLRDIDEVQLPGLGTFEVPRLL